LPLLRRNTTDQLAIYIISSTVLHRSPVLTWLPLP